MGQAPASGRTLLSINLTATYTGNDPQGDSPWSSITFASPDGTTTDTTSGSTLFIADHGFDSLKTVFEGASVKRDELLEGPAGHVEGRRPRRLAGGVQRRHLRRGAVTTTCA